jgi:hypothetical protein
MKLPKISEEASAESSYGTRVREGHDAELHNYPSCHWPKIEVEPHELKGNILKFGSKDAYMRLDQFMALLNRQEQIHDVPVEKVTALDMQFACVDCDEGDAYTPRIEWLAAVERLADTLGDNDKVYSIIFPSCLSFYQSIDEDTESQVETMLCLFAERDWFKNVEDLWFPGIHLRTLRSCLEGVNREQTLQVWNCRVQSNSVEFDFTQLAELLAERPKLKLYVHDDRPYQKVPHVPDCWKSQLCITCETLPWTWRIERGMSGASPIALVDQIAKKAMWDDWVAGILANGQVHAPTRLFNGNTMLYETTEHLWPSRLWGGFECLRKALCSNAKCRVAILDTGIDLAHPAFRGVCIRGKSFIEGDNWWFDANGHGTHCAGIIAGVGIGVAHGRCELLIGKVLDSFGKGRWTELQGGLKWASEQGAHVVSLSLASEDYNAQVHHEIQKLMLNDIIVVCAAGNDGRKRLTTIGHPANAGDVICVGAHGEDGKEASTSSTGREIDFLAPGVKILSAWPVHYQSESCVDLGAWFNREGRVPSPDWRLYRFENGTSMAAPHVSGLAALFVSFRLGTSDELMKLICPYNFTLNTFVMKKILQKMCTSPGSHSQDRGYGVLRPWDFIKMLLPSDASSASNTDFMKVYVWKLLLRHVGVISQ